MKPKREALWLVGSAAVATAFCLYASDYGFSPVPFFTVAVYLLSGVVRLVLGPVLRFLKSS